MYRNISETADRIKRSAVFVVENISSLHGETNIINVYGVKRSHGIIYHFFYENNFYRKYK